LFLNEHAGGDDLTVIGFSMGAYYALDLLMPILNTSFLLSSFTGPGPTNLATQEPTTSVTLLRTMSLSRYPTSTAWRNPSSALAAR